MSNFSCKNSNSNYVFCIFSTKSISFFTDGTIFILLGGLIFKIIYRYLLFKKALVLNNHLKSRDSDYAIFSL